VSADGQSVTINGVSYPVNPDGSVTIGGVSYPVTSGSTTPGSTTPGSTTPGSITVNGVQYPVDGQSATINGVSYPVNPDGTVTVGGVSYPVTSGSTTPGSTTPGSTTPGSTTPGSTTGGSTTGGSTSTPTSSQPLTIGAPKVNGKSADAPGAAHVPAGKSQKVSFTVTNTGDTQVSDVQGSAAGQQMSCSSTDLAPGETATCTGRVVPSAGDQTSPIVVSATKADGSRTTAHRSLFMTGTAPASATTGQSVTTGSGVAQAGFIQPASNVGAVTGSVPSTVAGAVGATHAFTGVPGPIQQMVNPSLGAFPIPRGSVGSFTMPSGAVAAGGGGMAHVTADDNGSIGEESPWVWSLLIAGGGAVAIARSRQRSHR
jgi:hypothetical protein